MQEKFYTSVYRRGDNIFYMGYEDGIPVKRKIQYQPHLFVNDPKGEYMLFNSEQKLKRKDFNSIKTMKEFIDKYEDVPNYGIYGCSDVVRQFVAEEFKGEIKWDYKKVQLKFLDIETTVEHLTVDPETKIRIRKVGGIESICPAKKLLILDETFEVFDDAQDDWVLISNSSFVDGGFPEPEKAEEEITIITMMDNSTGKITTWSLFDVPENDIRSRLKTYIKENFPDDAYTDDLFDYRFFSDEKSMLKDFIIYFKTVRIDFLTGWYSEGFDIPYIMNRIKRLFSEKVLDMLSPWGIVKSRTKITDKGTTEIFEIVGITHLDSIDMYKKFNPGGKESFQLNFIATEELGVGKVDMPGESFKEGYIKHPLEFCLYNIIDVYLLWKLEQKMALAYTAMELGFIGKCQFGDSLSAMRFWESSIYNYFKDDNIVETLSKRRNEREDVVGGYVSEPKPNKYGWYISVDGESLYPSIMIQNNLSPETFYDKLDDVFIEELLSGKHIKENLVPDGCIISGNGVLTKKDKKGFIPILVERVFDDRKKAKNKMLELKKEAEALKIKIAELEAKQQI